MIAIVLYSVFRFSGDKMFALLGVLVIGVALILSVFLVMSTNRMTLEFANQYPVVQQGLSRIPESLSKRMNMVLSGWKQFRDNPLGLSPHGMRLSETERNVHNDYAAYLYERGILGFAGLVFLFGGAVIRAIYSGFRGDDANRRYMATLLAVLLITIFTEFVHEYMREREVWLGMAMIVLFTGFEYQRLRHERRLVQKRNWPWAFVSASRGAWTT
jgi:O-antigen ligase